MNKLIKKIFGACDIEIMNEPIIKKKNYNLIILSGGNTILNFSKKSEDVIRSKLDNIAFKHAKKYKTKIVSCKTVRNKDSLALSSRNQLLNKKDWG